MKMIMNAKSTARKFKNLCPLSGSNSVSVRTHHTCTRSTPGVVKPNTLDLLKSLIEYQRKISRLFSSRLVHIV